MLLGHLHRVGSLGHRGKILDWLSVIVSPRTATCHIRSDKSMRAIRLCQRGTSPATSCLGPWQTNWTHRWRECICRLNIRGRLCFGDILSNWSHGKERWVKLRGERHCRGRRGAEEEWKVPRRGASLVTPTTVQRKGSLHTGCI